MIQVEPCKGCGTIVLMGEMMGLRAKCDPSPLDAQEAVAALLAGRELHRVTYIGGRPANLSPARPAVLEKLRVAEPGERPMVVGSHACPTTNGSAPAWRPSSTPGGTTPPKGGGRPPAPPSRPSSGSLTDSSTHASAPDASQKGLQRPSDGRTAPCSTCGTPITLDAPETAVLIHLGATLVDAFHTACP